METTTADEIKIRTQATPNPNAKKFVVSQDIKSQGKVSFSSIEECMHIDLARELFLITNVTQVHFFENIITLTQNGLSDWDVLAAKARDIIFRLVPSHDPNFMTSDEVRRSNLSPEAKHVEDILDRYIRPALRMDGGDVEVIEIDGFVVTLRYEGACGSCPSSQLGTLEAIRSALREEYHPEVEVVTV